METLALPPANSNTQSVYSQKMMVKTKKFFPPTHPALIVTQNFDAKHIQKLKDAFKQNYIPYGMQTSFKKCQNMADFDKDKLFVIVDDTPKERVLLQGEFQSRAHQRIDYPKKNKLEKVIKQFDQYIGLGKWKEQIKEVNGYGKTHRPSIQEKVLHMKQSSSVRKIRKGQERIRLKSVGNYSYQQISKRVLFVFEGKTEKKEYLNYIKKFENSKNNKLIVIRSIDEYLRYHYSKQEGHNSILTSPRSLQQVQKFPHLKYIYLLTDGENKIDMNKKKTQNKSLLYNISLTEEAVDRLLAQRGFDSEECAEYIAPNKITNRAHQQKKQNECLNVHHEKSKSNSKGCFKFCFGSSNPQKGNRNRLIEEKEPLYKVQKQDSPKFVNSNKSQIRIKASSRSSISSSSSSSSSSEKTISLKKDNGSGSQNIMCIQENSQQSHISSKKGQEIKKGRSVMFIKLKSSRSMPEDQQRQRTQEIEESSVEKMQEIKFKKGQNVGQMMEIESIAKDVKDHSIVGSQVSIKTHKSQKLLTLHQKKILKKSRICSPVFDFWNSTKPQYYFSNEQPKTVQRKAKSRKRFVTHSQQKHLPPFRILAAVEDQIPKKDQEPQTKSTFREKSYEDPRIKLSEFDKFYQNGITIYRPKINSDYYTRYQPLKLAPQHSKSRYIVHRDSYLNRSRDFPDKERKQEQFLNGYFPEKKTLEGLKPRKKVTHSCIRPNYKAKNQITKDFSVLYLLDKDDPSREEVVGITDNMDTVQIYKNTRQLNNFIEKAHQIYDEIVVLIPPWFNKAPKIHNIVLMSIKNSNKLPSSVWKIDKPNNIPTIIKTIRKEGKYVQQKSKSQNGSSTVSIYWKDFNQAIFQFQKSLSKAFPQSQNNSFSNYKCLPMKLSHQHNFVIFDETEIKQVIDYTNRYEKLSCNVLKICIPKQQQFEEMAMKFPENIMWVSQKQAKSANYIISRLQMKLK